MKDDFIFLCLYTSFDSCIYIGVDQCTLTQVLHHRRFSRRLLKRQVLQAAIVAGSKVKCHKIMVPSLFFPVTHSFPCSTHIQNLRLFCICALKMSFEFLTLTICLFYSFYTDITHKHVLVSQIWYDITLQCGIFTADSFRHGNQAFCTIIFYDISSIKYEICIEKIVQRIIIFID